MTVFHLLRHGEHSLVGRVLAGRMPGVGLSERGRAEAEAAASLLLAGGAIEALYSSPLQRTRETAEIVGRRLDLPTRLRDDIIEVDYGEWTGTTFDAVRADPRWPPWQGQRSVAAIPGGETMRAVQQRIAEALCELHREHGDAAIVLVSHGDVIRAALLFALGMPLDFYNRIEIATGAVSTIRLDAAGIRVVALNERPRLGR